MRPGTRTLNLNRRGMLFWPTTSVITEVVPGHQFAFRVPLNTTVWSYELEPTATGTRLIETQHAENGVTAVPPSRPRSHSADWTPSGVLKR